MFPQHQTRSTSTTGGTVTGTGNVADKDKQFIPFKEALLHARYLKLKNKKAWQVISKSGARPPNIPSRPDRVYKHDGWQGWGHWLDTGSQCTKEFLPFKKALLYARSLKRKNQKEWAQWCKSDVRPPNMPSHPDLTYKHDGWQGYGHWLGTGNVGVSTDQ